MTVKTMLTAGYLLLINGYLLGLMFYDKRRALQKKWRVPEKRLLLTGILGGGLGGLTGMRLFHHKTRKPRFYAANVLGIATACALLYYMI